MIRTTASPAALRSTVRSGPARRPVLLILLLLTTFALVGTVAVGQRAAAAELSRDDIWVSADGVAFQRGSESDEVAYVVRPADGRGQGRAFARDLSRNEQRNGWTGFWEAGQAYPDGYCVVWVEVEDASNWHETAGRTACTAAEPTDTPTPTPTPADEDDQQPPAVPPTPDEDQGGDHGQDQDHEQPVVTVSTPTPTPSVTPTPTPSATPTPSVTPSPSVSGTPTPSPSHSAPEAALVQKFPGQTHVRTQVDAAEQDEMISPLGWVAVLGSGGLLTAGGFLMLWRRLV